jgi:DNA primase catalytic subunit
MLKKYLELNPELFQDQDFQNNFYNFLAQSNVKIPNSFSTMQTSSTSSSHLMSEKNTFVEGQQQNKTTATLQPIIEFKEIIKNAVDAFYIFSEEKKRKKTEKKVEKQIDIDEKTNNESIAMKIDEPKLVTDDVRSNEAFELLTFIKSHLRNEILYNEFYLCLLKFICVPRIDENVTRRFYHAIKMPFCVHNATNAISHAISEEDILNFYPSHENTINVNELFKNDKETVERFKKSVSLLSVQ